MRATLKNLEKCEQGIALSHAAGSKAVHNMRDWLAQIKRDALWEALEKCENFEQYVTMKRIPLDRSTAFREVRRSEVEGYIEKSRVCDFSSGALDKLGTIRQDSTDPRYEKSQDIDVDKLRRVIKRLLKDNRTLTTGNGQSQVTAPMVTKAIEDVLGEKEPKKWHEQLELRMKSEQRWLLSARTLDEDVWLDAEFQSPGIAKRLARVYSEIASLLRKV